MNETRQENTRSLFLSLVEKNAFAIVVAALSAFTAILNLWAFSKLAPITQNQAVITSRVDAIEARSVDAVSRTEFNTTIDSFKLSIGDFRSDTNNRFDRIERKLDQQ